ncbi:MAG: S9 family peptidase, partial [Dokdonella sp.]
FAGWIADGSGMLIATRFGNTTQIHQVLSAGGARTQLTFYDEPIASVAVHPARNGFVFGKDTGGAEFYQLYWFDLATREVTLLTDGKSRNSDPMFSHDGSKLAYSSTARNGTDTDVWVRDMASGISKPVLTGGGTWQTSDFSPDGSKLLAQRVVSISETQPVVVDLDSGKIRRISDPDKKTAFDTFLFAPDGKGAYYVADESGEFRHLIYHDFASDKYTHLSANIPWDISEFSLSRDGAHLAFVANEDGYGILHVLDTTTQKEIALPSLPKGAIGSPDFSPDGKRLAFSLNSPLSPSDVYVIDLTNSTLVRWTTSEVGGLDTSTFTAPSLIRYPTFDTINREPRTIPAFFYQPAGPGPHPVIINIHGGPESQARPGFSSEIQFLVGELGIALLQPNVRGSSGYGKSYVDLDNGYKREDSVRDIGALLDWIATQPNLDPKRVAVQGGSYGGYMVLASMIHYGDRLRAGIETVGISNFVTFLSNTEKYRRDLRRVEYGDERNGRMRTFQQRISPLTNAAKIRIPLFVAQGANDPRVPPSEGVQIVNTVRRNSGDVWFLQFDDEGHGFRKKANLDYFRAASMLFWERYLLNDATLR